MSNALRILVIGRDGQLARALAAQGNELLTIICVERPEFDLAKCTPLDPLLALHKPHAVINAAAHTAVDRAESEPDLAFALNRDGPSQLAGDCAAADIPMVHVSTDYVFDGAKTAPYLETDPTCPQSVYGQSKAEGEQAILNSRARATILRTSWVYDAGGANFVKTMLRLAGERDDIRVVADQIGRPTWAADLAHACLIAADALIAGRGEAAGVFHYAGEGDASWADLAAAAMQESAARGGASARITPITTADYPTPARRPANSRLDCTKFTQTFRVAPRPWREALSLCMDEIFNARPPN